MFLRLGLISFALLLASRISGLVRESAQAAAFGVSGKADVAILMLTLPDLLVNVFFLGGLSYIALPLWASQSPQDRARSQRTMLVWCLGVGVTLSLVLVLTRQWVIQTLAPGLPRAFMPIANNGIIWSALLIAPTCLAALWYCRLQFERDFIGLYGWNVLVNGVMIAAFAAIHVWFSDDSIATLLGMALVLAMALRLLWQAWRLSRLNLPLPLAEPHTTMAWPGAHQFAWAALAAGLPLTLPLIARTLSAASGEGALAVFNYAIKLVELPNALAIQLVTTLAFPSVTRALAAWRESSAAGVTAQSWLPDMRSVRSAYILAWVLACAGAAGLALGAQPVAKLLFGWGRMRGADVLAVAELSAVGAWSLLPQALIAVTVTVLAANQQLKAIAFAFLGTAIAFVLAGWMPGVQFTSGQAIMGMNISFVVLAATLMTKSRILMWRSLPALEMAIVATGAVVCVWVGSLVDLVTFYAQMLVAAGGALSVSLVGLAVSPSLRSAIKR